MSNPTQGKWECHHGVDGRNHCDKCSNPSSVETREVDVQRLYATTDAAIWAEEFMAMLQEQLKTRRYEQIIDFSLMVGWFANAIETAKHVEAIPIRLCCGQRHPGLVCPDGKIMCCLCFNRVEQADLAFEDGQRVDVCVPCRTDELTRIQNRS